MLRLTRMFARSEAGSISAPARKVSTPLPSMARKLIHSVVLRMWWPSPREMFPTTTPTRISMSATEMPRRMEMRLARSASPIQIAARNQMLSSIGRFAICDLRFVDADCRLPMGSWGHSRFGW